MKNVIEEQEQRGELGYSDIPHYLTEEAMSELREIMRCNSEALREITKTERD